MSKFDKIGGGFEIVDADGSVERFFQNGPKVVRKLLQAPLQKTAFVIGQRMKATVRVSDDAPHLRDLVTTKGRGLSWQVGYIDGQGGELQAGEHSEWKKQGIDHVTVAMTALFEEYNPNKHPFMRTAAEAESKEFVREMTDTLQQVERALSGGGLL